MWLCAAGLILSRALRGARSCIWLGYLISCFTSVGLYGALTRDLRSGSSIAACPHRPVTRWLRSNEKKRRTVDPSAVALVGRWQARCLERGRSPICDQGSSAPYIGVDIADHSSLQSALNAWHHQHYTYALSDPPRLLCLQLGRFRHEGRRTVKVRHKCQVPKRLQVPVFGGELLECTAHEYILCSGIVHVGDTAASGHYRAMCVHSPFETVRSEGSSPVLRYTLCDDDRQASQRSPNLDNLLDHNLYVVMCSRLDPESGPPGRS